MLPKLVYTLDRFLEAAGRVSKQRALAPIERRIERKLKPAFDVQARAFLDGFTRFEKSWPVQESLREAVADELGPLFETGENASFNVFLGALGDAEQAALAAGAASLIAQLKINYSFSLKNPRAVAYLQEHGADLVKRINETTKGEIQHVVTYATEHGWSYQKTALAIQRKFAGYYDPGSWWNFDQARPQGHIDSRAHLIAVTEAGEAYESSNYMVVQDLAAAGLELEKHWSTMGDDKVSDGCRANSDEGWIPAEQPHQSGHMHPLRFPGCRCDELYQVKE